MGSTVPFFTYEPTNRLDKKSSICSGLFHQECIRNKLLSRSVGWLVGPLVTQLLFHQRKWRKLPLPYHRRQIQPSIRPCLCFDKVTNKTPLTSIGLLINRGGKRTLSSQVKHAPKFTAFAASAASAASVVT